MIWCDKWDGYRLVDIENNLYNGNISSYLDNNDLDRYNVLDYMVMKCFYYLLWFINFNDDYLFIVYEVVQFDIKRFKIIIIINI
jgi:hypothetical protein